MGAGLLLGLFGLISTLAQERSLGVSTGTGLNVFSDPIVPQTSVSVQTLKGEGSEWGDFRSRVFSFRFDRTPSIDFDLPVFYTVSGVAKAGVDFRDLPGSIVIPAGQTSVELLVETLNDDLAEGDEWMALTVEPPICVLIFPPPRECYRVGEFSVAKALIRDDEIPTATEAVRIEATVAGTRELCAANVPCTKELVLPGLFTLTRSGPPEGSLTVYVDYSGSAVAGMDYEGLPKAVTFAAGQRTVQLRVLALGDYLKEGDETVVATLVEPGSVNDPSKPVRSAYLIEPGQGSAKVVIQDRPAILPTGIVITAPVSGTVQIVGNPVTIQAVAVDRLGAITRLEFFDGDSRIGESEIFFIQPPEIGAPISHEFVWKGASVGDHVITARGVDAAGTVLTSAKVLIHYSTDRPSQAFVQIVSPKTGERFVQTDSISLVASAVDPAGAITHLDWYANGEKIGSSDIYFIRPPDPGMPVTHEARWTNARKGVYRVMAVGTDSAGRAVESESIQIEVVESGGVDPAPQVVVDIVQSDGLAFEVGSDGTPDPGVLKVRRIAGPRDVTISVNYSVSGSAAAGVDYASLPGTVLIPAGEDSAPLVFLPISDKALEPDESVIVTLNVPICPAIFPPPPNCYLISKSDTARVVIRGDGIEDTKGGRVALITPRNGEVFELGKPVKLAASAATPTGKIVLVEIMVDGKMVAATKDSDLSWEWKDASPGTHRILARAMNEQGNESSSAVAEIYVRDAMAAGGQFPDRTAARAEIQKIARSNSGRVQLQIGGPGSQLIALEMSDDLNKWFQLDPALVPSDGVFTVEDEPGEGVRSRFYRVKTLPTSP